MGSTRLGRRSAAIWYLRSQALAGGAWWLLLLSSSAFRRRFELAPDRHRVLDAFLLGDASLFILGSILAAELLARRSIWAPTATALTAGASAEATLYLANWVVLGGAGGPGIIPMFIATMVTGWIVVLAQREAAR